METQPLRGVVQEAQGGVCLGVTWGVFGITQGSALQLQAPTGRSGLSANLPPQLCGMEMGEGRGLKVAHCQQNGGGSGAHVSK